MISEKRQRFKYVSVDFLSSNVAWFAFNCIRFSLGAVKGHTTLISFLLSPNVLLGQLAFPLLMMCVYVLSGYYVEVFRKSRLLELLTTATSSVFNTLLLFFAALINDVGQIRGTDYEVLLVLFSVIFLCVYVARAIITNAASLRIKSGRWRFNTVMVGAGKQARRFIKRMEKAPVRVGNEIVAHLELPGEVTAKGLNAPVLSLNEIEKVCKEMDVKEIFIVPTKQSTKRLLSVIDGLYSLNLPIKLASVEYDVVLTRSRVSNLYGEPLIDISGSTMSDSEKIIKRLFDIVLSAIALLVLLPFFAIIAVLIKLDSEGSVFFSQERVGYRNKVFNIYKFRSMISDAEADGSPQLSSSNDKRVTRVGHYLRKYRFDELPQFWNVLKGDMSLVGPRPERQYYIDQITAIKPAYTLVHQVRPGLTSMGMVKFGYAENVPQMVRRMKYDLIYLENMSLLNDMKIMLYTIKIVFTGKGV